MKFVTYLGGGLLTAKNRQQSDLCRALWTFPSIKTIPSDSQKLL